MPKLTVYQPDGSSVKYGLNGRSFTVGRGDGNDIVLPGGSASNHHAVLKSTDDGDFSVTDFDSTNHTRVNGQIVQTKMLSDGDEIHFGDILALYSSELAPKREVSRSSPKFERDPEPEPAEEAQEEEEASASSKKSVKTVRPSARRGAAAPGGMVQAPPAQGKMSAGEGCFALLMLIGVAGAAFVLGVWLRHHKDHNGQSLPDYVSEWRADKAKVEAAAAKKQ
jgi:hypothetical protein